MISNILGTSKKALLSSQWAINNTAKNIANVNTTGFTRRRINPGQLLMGYGNPGMNNVARIRQRFVETQLNYENQSMGKFQSDEMIMTQVEGIFGEPLETGLSNIMAEFWNSWSDLSNDPESQQARALVKDKGILLTQSFNRIHKDLQNLHNQITVDIEEKIKDVNRLVDQIKVISDQINGNPVNDLLDQRDVFVSELSNLIDIDVRESENGDITISTGGQVLITGDYKDELVSRRYSDDGLFAKIELSFRDSGRPVNIQSGEIGSLLDIQRNQIPASLDKLNTLATTIAKGVNNTHKRGFNLDGETNINFFAKNISGAHDFQLSEEILRDPSLIASSPSADSPGNGGIAMEISNFQFDSILDGNTLSEYYNSMISSVGSKTQQAQFLRQNQEKVIQSLQNQRDAISGVSLDEEMTKLIEFEQSYQAAARMISVADELIQTILQIV